MVGAAARGPGRLVAPDLGGGDAGAASGRAWRSPSGHPGGRRRPGTGPAAPRGGDGEVRARSRRAGGGSTRRAGGGGLRGDPAEGSAGTPAGRSGEPPL